MGQRYGQMQDSVAETKVILTVDFFITVCRCLFIAIVTQDPLQASEISDGLKIKFGLSGNPGFTLQ